jgi:beta-galactosidase
LSSPLQRGPTPPGDSVVVTRIPVKIAGVSAGSNAEQARLAIDDNERTSWSNDGRGSNGWIRFTFDSPARVNEVTLKLGGWRTKSYPIRVRVDDKVVFSGQTPRSLGYVTLTFPPTQGKTLTIELLGGSRDRDAFGGITELAGGKDAAATGQDEASRRGGRDGGGGKLQIVEAEVYQPLPAQRP